jgi:hypothetical protein
MAYTNEYIQKIYEILIPLIGGLIARATINSNISALGIKEESVSRNDLPLLAEHIKKGLVVFLGSDAAEKVALKIKSLT